MGYLFVIDGTDGSGKNTQATELLERLIDHYGFTEEKDICKVSFPHYGDPSCTMVEKYLHGEFGTDPTKIDPYTASMFYMIDRSISFRNDKWGEIYRNNGIVIADRYYTSNIIHQGAKILMEHEGERNSNGRFRNEVYSEVARFNSWLSETELNKIKLPKPNKIFWLIADGKTNESFMKNRIETDASHVTDIHEADSEYLKYCREALKYHKDEYDFKIEYRFGRTADEDIFSNILKREEFIDVLNDLGSVKPIAYIAEEIYKSIKCFFGVNNIFPIN